MLFDAVAVFDFAAAFECCRLHYPSAKSGYDAGGFFRGWELQTGVMAYRRNHRMAAFWNATAVGARVHMHMHMHTHAHTHTHTHARTHTLTLTHAHCEKGNK